MSPSEIIVQSKEELLRRIHAAAGPIVIIGAGQADAHRHIDAGFHASIIVSDDLMHVIGLADTMVSPGLMPMQCCLPLSLTIQSHHMDMVARYEEPFIVKHNHKRLKFQGTDESIVSGDMKMKQEHKNKKRKDRKRKNNHKRKQR